MKAAKRKEILDKASFVTHVCDVAASSVSPSGNNKRNKVVDLLKHNLQSVEAELKKDFLAHPKPRIYLKSRSKLIDGIVEAAFAAAEISQNEMNLTDKLCCIAVGGYGRNELFPYSDIDLLFIYDEKEQSIAKEIIESILYYLWDTGLRIGHSVRSIDDCTDKALDDHTIISNLMDRRYLCGNKSLFNKLDKRFEHEVIGQDIHGYVASKLAERKERHDKQGNSRFILQPNIKENKGALRDLHSLYWLARYVYGVKSLSGLVKLDVMEQKEYRDFKNACEFLWVVRIYLHLLSGRAEEQLTFDMQVKIGGAMGYRTSHEHRPVERFMKRYFQVAKTVGDLTRLLCAVLEEEHKRTPTISLSRILERTKQIDDFIIRGQRLNFLDSADLKANPILMLQLFHTAQDYEVDIHPSALQRVSRNLKSIDKTLRANAEANRLFLDMLLAPNQPELTLRRLNESGVLAKFIPEFGRVVGQMQYDMYHVYTVDEHTIRAIGILHQIETGQHKEELPLSSSIISHIESRHIVYMAMLCHDIAKGSGGNHHTKGEAIVRKLAKRFGFSDAETEMTAWLVREHLLCSEVAFKRDLNDPKTIADFVEKVQSPEQLRMLLIVTVCDMRAVGPNIWNRWKGSLLRDLYNRAEEQMGMRHIRTREPEIERFKQAMQKHVSKWREEEQERYFSIGFPAFWLGCSIEQHKLIADQLKSYWANEPDIVFHHKVDSFRGITEVIVCVPNHHALITIVSGSVAVAGGSIQSAKVFTMRDGSAVAMLDIQDQQQQAFQDERRLNKLRQTILDALSGQINLSKAVAEQQKAYRRMSQQIIPAQPRVFIDNEVSNRYTVIEVNGTDQIGFLYNVTQALIDLRLTIATAHITTYGEKAVDVFYVKDIFGLKIANQKKLEHIREALITHMNDKQPKRKSG